MALHMVSSHSMESEWKGDTSSSPLSVALATGMSVFAAKRAVIRSTGVRLVLNLISIILLALALIATLFGLPKVSLTLLAWSFQVHQQWVYSAPGTSAGSGRSSSSRQT